MGIRYEWHEQPRVEVIQPGCDVSTGLPADEDTPYERLAEHGAMVLFTDEAAVITGDLDQFVRNILTAMHNPEAGPAYRPRVCYRLMWQGRQVRESTDRADIDDLLAVRVEAGFPREEHSIQARKTWTVTSPWSEVR